MSHFTAVLVSMILCHLSVYAYPHHISFGARIDFNFNDSVTSISTDGDTPSPKQPNTPNFAACPISFDLEELGQSIDFGRPESGSSFGTPSSRGCPPNDAGYPWVYFSGPFGVNCYQTGKKGPCAAGQLLLIAEKGDLFGHCNCDCFHSLTENGHSNVSNPFCLRNKEYFYNSELKSCFALYSQGPCKSDEWIVKSSPPSSTSLTTCEKRKCDKNQVPVLNEYGEFAFCSSPMPPPAAAAAIGGANPYQSSTTQTPKFLGG